jgi:hypothetical protein
MKRNSAQAGEGKLESRFAALTSGLLARKGHAAPSNSPIHDPAEETDAFALEPTRGGARKTPPPVTAPPATAPAKSQAAPPAAKAPGKDAARAEAAKKPAAPAAEPDAAKPAAKPATVADSKPPTKAAAAESKSPPAKAAASPITIINERSEAAGYPDNPSPEEIAALEAEADEVVSYFENFGNDDAVALEKDSFYGVDDDEDDDDDDFDGLDDLDDSELQDRDADDDAKSDPLPGVAVAGPWAGASVPPVAANAAEQVRAGVTVQLTAREFMRLSLGAVELQQSSQELIAEAIEEYLDARGVLSLGGCSCLEALTKKPDGV